MGFVVNRRRKFGFNKLIKRRVRRINKKFVRVLLFRKRIINSNLFRYLKSYNRYFGMFKKIKGFFKKGSRGVVMVKKYKKIAFRRRRIKRVRLYRRFIRFNPSRIRFNNFKNKLTQRIKSLKYLNVRSKIFSDVVIERILRIYFNRKILYGSQIARRWLLLYLGRYYHPIRSLKGRQYINRVRLAALPSLVGKLAIQKRTRKNEMAWTRFKTSKFFVLLRQSFNNCFVTIITKAGRVLYVCSTGLVGFKGPRRTTQPAAEAVGRAVAKFIRRRRLLGVGIVLKSPVTSQIKSAITGLESKKIRYSGIIDLISTPHNGIRKRKVRRV